MQQSGLYGAQTEVVVLLQVRGQVTNGHPYVELSFQQFASTRSHSGSSSLQATTNDPTALYHKRRCRRLDKHVAISVTGTSLLSPKATSTNNLSTSTFSTVLLKSQTTQTNQSYHGHCHTQFTTRVFGTAWLSRRRRMTLSHVPNAIEYPLVKTRKGPKQP